MSGVGHARGILTIAQLNRDVMVRQVSDLVAQVERLVREAEQTE
jgi:hypothetical protein